MKILKITSIFFIGLGLGLAIYYFSFPPFSKLSPEEMHQQIISQRDFAIKEAIAHGDYNCCVEPVCTMCYMEANQWNHQTAGTCDCAGFIAQGEEPCPQCQRALTQTEEGSCTLDVGSECNLE